MLHFVVVFSSPRYRDDTPDMGPGRAQNMSRSQPDSECHCLRVKFCQCFKFTNEADGVLNLNWKVGLLDQECRVTLDSDTHPDSNRRNRALLPPDMGPGWAEYLRLVRSHWPHDSS